METTPLDAVPAETPVLWIYGEALERATPEQRASIMVLLGHGTRLLHVTYGGFGLPDTYLSFRREYHDGRSIFGGIDPEGSVST